MSKTAESRINNLEGVPSYHFSTVFSVEVQRKFNSFRPTAVAIEVPSAYEGELNWALSCWPTPVASANGGLFYPFVPGDSIAEAFRHARAHSIHVYGIDLDVVEPAHRAGDLYLSPEFAPRVGHLYQETIDAHERVARVSRVDLAREAFMAKRLSELLDAGERVLWVGGAAHWMRIQRRIMSGNYRASAVRTGHPAAFRRMRLDASSIIYLSGERIFPDLMRRFVMAPPCEHDDASALHALALDAVPPDDHPAADIARVILYARNLTAGAHLQEIPGLFDLITSASAVIDNRYAARLYRLAMREEISAAAAGLQPLTVKIKSKKTCLYLGDKPIRCRSGFPRVNARPIPRLPWEEDIERRANDTPYKDIAAPVNSNGDWHEYPPDEEAYEAFVQYVLRHATVQAEGDPQSVPFQTGMMDGVDVRETLRHWHEDKVYVRSKRREKLNFTSGIIDFSSLRENAPVLRGESVTDMEQTSSGNDFWPRMEGMPQGDRSIPWVDPRYLRVGSISRMKCANETLQERPCAVIRLYRAFSMITLDCPNCDRENRTNGFDRRVIEPLLTQCYDATDDNIYGWLDRMFSFCRRKPVAYFSKYKPGQKIHALAAKHGVRLAHFRLDRISPVLLERNKSFRVMKLTDQQWDVVRARVAEHRRAWTFEKLPDPK